MCPNHKACMVRVCLVIFVDIATNAFDSAHRDQSVSVRRRTGAERTRRIQTEINLCGRSIQHDRASRVSESSAANREGSDAMSQPDSSTTCPDGQQTSTDSVADGSTVTGTNTGAGFFAKARFRAGDFVLAITGDATAASSRARSSRFQ